MKQLDVAGDSVSRRCSAKAAKHKAVRILAASKLNTVHSHISKALEDCQVSDDEHKLILDEVEKYGAMKEDLHRKHAPAAGSVVDEAYKKQPNQTGTRPSPRLVHQKAHLRLSCNCACGIDPGEAVSTATPAYLV